MSGDTDLDKDLQAMLKDDDDPTVDQSPDAEPTKPEASKIKAGGREFDNQDALAEAYGELLKDHTKKSQVSADAKRWLAFAKNLEENPSLKSKIHDAVKTYNAGQPAAGPRSKNDSLAQDVAALKSQLEGIALQREEESLRQKFSLKDDDIVPILEKANELGGSVPLEFVYRAMAYDKQKAAAQTEADKKAKDNAKAKKGADIGSSTAANVAPSSKKVTELSESEVDAAILKELEDAGY